MSKYSIEFKIGVVNAYLNGEGGYRTLAEKYGKVVFNRNNILSRNG